MIITYAVNWSVIYDRKFTILNLSKYRPQVAETGSWYPLIPYCWSLNTFQFCIKVFQTMSLFTGLLSNDDKLKWNFGARTFCQLDILPITILSTSCLYHKNIMMIVSDDFKWSLYYKYAMALALASLSVVNYNLKWCSKLWHHLWSSLIIFLNMIMMC